MSFEHLSTKQPSLFAQSESAGASPAPQVKSARSANRAAWWEQDLSRTATYLMGQARSDEERAFVERLYDEAFTDTASGHTARNAVNLDAALRRSAARVQEVARKRELPYGSLW